VRVLRSAEPTGPDPDGDRVPDTDPADILSPASETPPPLVLVRWRDAWFDPEQLGADDWREDYPVMTVGFLVRDDGVVVSVAQEILPDGDGYRAVTHIPAPIVVSMTVLTEGPEAQAEAAEAAVAAPHPAPIQPAIAQLSSQESSA